MRAPGLLAAGALFASAVGYLAAMVGYWMLVPIAAVVAAAAGASVWRHGFARPTSIVDTQSNLLLIALPTVLGTFVVNVNIAIYAVAVLAVAGLWMRQNADAGIQLFWGSAALPVVGILIAVRVNYPATTRSAIFFTLACIALCRAVYLSSSRRSALSSLVDGIGVFLVASVVLQLAGVRAGDTTVDMGNSITGGERVMFPLANGLAATPAMAAVYLAAVTPILLATPRHRILRLFGIPAAVYVLVYGDRRAALIGAVLIGSAILFVPKAFRRIAPWLIPVPMVLPFVYSYVQGAVGGAMSAISTVAPWFRRAGEDTGTLNGRDYVWSQSLDFYQHHVSWLHQAFGYGSYGQAASGVSATYSNMFGDLYRDHTQLTPHSSTLQILFDGGWTLVAVFAATIVSMSWMLTRGPSSIALPGLAMLATLSFVGATEVALSPSHAQPTWWVLVALGAITFSKDRIHPATTPSERQIQHRPPKAVEPKVAAPGRLAYNMSSG